MVENEERRSATDLPGHPTSRPVAREPKAADKAGPASAEPPAAAPSPADTPSPGGSQPSGFARPAGGIEFPPIAFGVIILVATFFSYQVIGGVLTYLLFGMDMGSQVQGLRIATVISQLAFLLAPPLLLLRLQRWDLRRVLRLRSPGLLPSVLVVTSVVALQFVLQGYLVSQQFVLKEFLLPASMIDLLEALEELIEGLYRQLLVMRSPAELAFVLLVAALTPALCEEVLFRGAVLGSMERGMRSRWAIVITGVVFSLFHLNPVTFVPLALLGMYIGFVVVRGGSLWLGVIAHAANNTIAVISLYFMEREALVQEQGASGAPTPELLLLAGAGFCVTVLSTLLFLRVTSRNSDPTP